jgi:hypothetical protein
MECVQQFSTHALRHAEFDVWLPVPSIMIAWGLVTTLMCLVNSYAGLIVSVCKDVGMFVRFIIILQCSNVPRTCRSWIVRWQVHDLTVYPPWFSIIWLIFRSNILYLSVVSSVWARQANRHFLFCSDCGGFVYFSITNPLGLIQHQRRVRWAPCVSFIFST